MVDFATPQQQRQEADRLGYARRMSDPIYRAKKRASEVRGALRRLEAKAGRSKPDACECCNKPHPKIVFDHCHDSGTFRGWICDPCNVALGMVQDDVSRLESLVQYLKDRQNG